MDIGQAQLLQPTSSHPSIRGWAAAQSHAPNLDRGLRLGGPASQSGNALPIASCQHLLPPSTLEPLSNESKPQLPDPTPKKRAQLPTPTRPRPQGSNPSRPIPPPPDRLRRVSIHPAPLRPSPTSCLLALCTVIITHQSKYPTSPIGVTKETPKKKRGGKRMTTPRLPPINQITAC